jgi:thiamine biosynthesis lipoprotein
VKRLATILVAGLTLLCCARHAEAAVARDGQLVMGTALTVTVVADSREKAIELAQQAIAEARRWDDALTIWRPDGELARMNARAGQGFLPVSDRLAVGLAAMLAFSRQTGGAFEPAVAVLPDAGDARVVLRGIRETLSVRTGSSVAATSAHRRGDVFVASASDRASARLAAGSALDPGGIGKGLALDAMAALLTRGGATAAFLDFGGSSQTAIGAPPGDVEGWSVVLSGLEAGRSWGTLRLKDASLSTSRSGATDTKPILDPRTKLPVPGPRLATVLAQSATAADAWSTALVVLGSEGIERAKSVKLQVLLEDAHGVRKTSGLVLTVGSSASTGDKVENESQIPHDRPREATARHIKGNRR